jgi:hypothetical protein
MTTTALLDLLRSQTALWVSLVRCPEDWQLVRLHLELAHAEYAGGWVGDRAVLMLVSTARPPTPPAENVRHWQARPAVAFVQVPLAGGNVVCSERWAVEAARGGRGGSNLSRV